MHKKEIGRKYTNVIKHGCFWGSLIFFFLFIFFVLSKNIFSEHTFLIQKVEISNLVLNNFFLPWELECFLPGVHYRSLLYCTLHFSFCPECQEPSLKVNSKNLWNLSSLFLFFLILYVCVLNLIIMSFASNYLISF